MDIDTIKKLREETGAGVMDAKRALEEADGDELKAVEIIRAKGLEKAEKKSDREASSGIVFAYVHGNASVGVLLELNSETDFVARNDVFQELAKELGMQIAAMGGESVDDVLAQEYIRDPKMTVDQVIKEAIGKIGENIVLSRFTRYELGE